MSTKRMTVPATLLDPKSGKEYKPCGLPAEGSKPCLRYTGHKGDHRPTLERPPRVRTPEQQAAREAYLAATDTPEKKQAYWAARREASKASKAPQPKAMKSAPVDPRTTVRGSTQASRRKTNRAKAVRT